MGTIPLLTGAVAKLFLRYGCRSVRVEGLPAFLGQLQSDRGILTVCNHVSTVDEPFMWGTLPLKMFLDSRRTRWTLGASDVMFNGKLDRWFFEKGQVIETFRGKGIYQSAIDQSAQKLDEGQWVHIFPEGRIKQDTLSELRRFKWGVSRMLMECEKTPLIVPIWLKGFEQVLDEPRKYPHYLPNRGKAVTIVFGAPLNPSIEPLLDTYRSAFPTPWRPSTYSRPVGEDMKDEPDELARMRSEMAEVLRMGVMKLGETVGEVEKKEPARLRWWS